MLFARGAGFCMVSRVKDLILNCLKSLKLRRMQRVWAGQRLRSLLLRRKDSLNARRVCLLSLLIFAVGCQSQPKHAALERQMREREGKIRNLEQQLANSEKLLADQDQELAALRDSSARDASDSIHAVSHAKVVSGPEETQVAWGSVDSLKIHTLTSGLMPASTQPGRLMNVVLQPLDDEGELVKVAGQLQVHVAAVQPDGRTVVLASEDYSITDSRRLWSRGLVSSGFHVQLNIPAEDWQQLTDTDQLLVTATLKLGGDRIFKTSELLPVR